ncbi:LuxR C-terminal-related transcriptional regulator [Streptomyces sp. NPDC051662]|uniref:helix-turn-helix transcriptional regulator n=1 Tax=Streptomyces sp. NPDC051662 TaxID=3154750 RepID=UPI0034478883
MVLIGRAQEKYRLLTAFASVQATGRSRTVLIEASAGCGKSELLGELVRHVESLGLTVLHTTAIEGERDNPLGVIHSLVNGAPFPDELVRRFHRMGDAAAGRIAAERRDDPRRDDTRRDADWYELMRMFCTEVRALARRAPVVVAVDDVHHGDADSLRQLLHLARHCCNVPVLLAFTRPLVGGPAGSGFGAELLRQPNLDRIPLSKLDLRGVGDFLAELGHPGASAELAERCFAISGGNPLLLRALLEDTRLDAESSADGPAVAVPRAGQAYGKAIVTCLDRSGEKVREVAAGLAVLGRAYTHDLLSRLLDMSAAELTENLQALRGAGIVAGTSFQHPAAKNAVLDSLEPSHRLDLHQRSAELLHAFGAAPAVAAEHLHKAGQADGAWAVEVLEQAAEQALLEDRARRAVSYLELAHAASEDPLSRAEIKIRLGSVARRISVTDAERHVDDALRVLRTGRLDPSDAGGLGELLLAHGRLEQARTLLGQTPRRSTDEARIRERIGEAPDSPARRRTRRLGGWSARPDDSTGPHPPADRAATGLRALLGGSHSGRRTQRIAATEGILEITQLTDATFDLVVDAIWTLLALGAVERALHWCDTFLRESAARNAPGWEAAFAAVRSEAARHGGDLAEAERAATRCLALLPERYPSALESAAIARLVSVQIARGDHEAAARLLSRPVADSLPDTVHWLHYLRARGLYYLATRQYDSALRDFREVGRVAERWGTDWPALLPWRTDIAEVLLRLGEREQGQRLATEQLALVQQGAPRVRGISLRLQALAAKPSARLALLNRAVVELNRADDPLELCRTLFDLADAHRQARQPRQAAMALRRARLLAKNCGAEPPRDRIGSHDPAQEPVERLFTEGEGEGEGEGKGEGRGGGEGKGEGGGTGGGGSGGRGSGPATGWEHLSESERRVASLAADGCTNREISGRLHITMSTVEQHLTRVYRKLSINGREELMSEICTGAQV